MIEIKRKKIFEVGDRVRVVDNPVDWSDGRLQKGKTGIVNNVWENQAWSCKSLPIEETYRVEVDFDDGGHWNFCAIDLEEYHD